MKRLLEDKVSVVAGSPRTVTATIVQALLQAGATVIMPAKSAQEIVMLKESLLNINTTKLVTLLTDYPDYDKAFEVAESITQQFGKIDLAVVCFDTHQSACGLTETDIMDWEKMIDHNITAFFIAARVLLDNMKENKQGMFISINHTMEIESCNSPLADLSCGMQKEMAKIFSDEVKGYNIKCHHLMAAHFTKPSLDTSSAKGEHGVADDGIGSFIIKLFNGETEDGGSVLQEISASALSNDGFVNQ
jgi:NAD(P)-dependent dehydrogenase (short-subunit alcohol dehydrogenase family)